MEGTDDVIMSTPTPEPGTGQSSDLESILEMMEPDPVEIKAVRFFDTLEVKWGDRNYRIKTENQSEPGLIMGFREAFSDGSLTQEEYDKYSPYSFAVSLDPRFYSKEDGVLTEIILTTASVGVGGLALMNRRKFLQVAGVTAASLGLAVMMSNNSRPKDGYGNSKVDSLREEISDVVEDRYSIIHELHGLFEAHKLIYTLGIDSLFPKDEIILASKAGVRPLDLAEEYLNEYGDMAFYKILERIDVILSEIDHEKYVIDILEFAFDTHVITLDAFPDQQKVFVTDWFLKDMFEKHGLVRKIPITNSADETF